MDDERVVRALDLMRQALVLLDEIPHYGAAARLSGAIDELGAEAPTIRLMGDDRDDPPP